MEKVFIQRTSPAQLASVLASMQTLAEILCVRIGGAQALLAETDLPMRQMASAADFRIRNGSA